MNVLLLCSSKSWGAIQTWKDKWGLDDNGVAGWVRESAMRWSMFSFCVVAGAGSMYGNASTCSRGTTNSSRYALYFCSWHVVPFVHDMFCILIRTGSASIMSMRWPCTTACLAAEGSHGAFIFKCWRYCLSLCRCLWLQARTPIDVSSLLVDADPSSEGNKTFWPGNVH